MQPRGSGSGSRLDGRTLQQLGELASTCQLCRLCDARANAVFGCGNPDADIMFVAEAPGYHDDVNATQLAGQAGVMFDSLLAGIGRTRDDVYVTSVVKCRPPRNRTPFPDEIEQCEGYLFHEVMLVQPRVICAMGNAAIRLLTGKHYRLSDVHGKPMVATVGERTISVLPIYHPGAAAHAPRLTQVIREDMQQIPALVRGEAPHNDRVIADPAPAATAAGDLDSGDSTQLTLEIGG